MKALEHFVSSPLAHAIGWTLLHSVWEGSVVALLLGVVFMAIRSPRARYIAACGALLAALCGFFITLGYYLPAHGVSAVHLKAPVLVWNSPAAATDRLPWYTNFASVVPWLALLWFAGIIFIYARVVASFVAVQRLRRRGVCSPPAAWQAELTRQARRIRVSRPVQLLESSLAEVPMVLGHFRPLILIPAGLLSGFPPSQIEAILLHELAHVRRHDYLINVAQRFAEGLLFYHPAAWWISNAIRVEREKCCDDLVVAVTADPREYALTLAALEQKRFAGHQPALAVTGGRLMKRIHRVLYPQTEGTAWTPLVAAAVLLTVGAVSVAAWQSNGAARESTGQEAQDANDAAKLEKAAKDAKQSDAEKLESYGKWLADVAYIIDDAERAAFRGLTTNAERDEFIEQFWARRNPTPGAASNAFKTEHYRRIAFSNQRFGTASGTRGWETDRGHIYIVYGAPDEIDSHPKEGQKPALEYWTYRHVEGVGDNVSITFVDRTGRGDYHLAPGSAH